MTVSFARLGLAGLAVAAAMAALSQPSAAQDGGKPAAAATPVVAPVIAADAAARVAKGRDLFANYGCSGCHTLADAGASGHVGPSLDGDVDLTEAFVADRVGNGQGQMPAFAGQMSADDIAAVAAYVTHVAAK